MNTILKGRVLWSFDHELIQRDSLTDFAAHFSGVTPFHTHSGEIALTAEKIIIKGDEDLDIPLRTLDKIYLGFDDIFPRTLVKNFGLFWQPLRISLINGQNIYLIIDYNMIGSKNQLWFDAIKEMASENI